MTSSNVSNLLVQVSQVDVSITSDKAASNVDAGLFEKTLQGVANKIPRVNSNSDSALPEKQPDKKTVSMDSSANNRTVQKEEKPMPRRAARKRRTEYEEDHLFRRLRGSAAAGPSGFHHAAG